MKKILFASMLAAIPAAISAQNAVEAFTLSQPDLRGTARFMSMAGAFGALGGDLSTLNQNPAGIGVYRSSDVGVTMDVDFQSSTVTDGSTTNNTHVIWPNVGYIGSLNLGGGTMPYFQWGISYGRVKSFNRTYAGGFGELGTSMSNYVANFTNGVAPATLAQSTSYNPYEQSTADWMSILAYNSYIINPIAHTQSDYAGLFIDNKTTGNSQFDVQTRGYVDEYAINFGGNLMNTVYWGIGFGITDLDYQELSNYDEELKDARVALSAGESDKTIVGNCWYNLNNYKHVSGTGFNFKIGAIVKPINELRLGIAVHTPTYYNMRENYDANIEYIYTSGPGKGVAYTNSAYFDWKLRSPWRLIASAAGVFGGRFIVSADYELNAYSDMRVSDGFGTEYNDITGDIKEYYKTASTIRVGAEFRVTPSFSIRAGYATTTSGLQAGVDEGDKYIYTSGTNPAYTFDNSTRYITCGLGYRYQAFYADLAYVNKYRKSAYHAFSPFDDSISWVYEPYAPLTTSENNLVLSLGFKF